MSKSHEDAIGNPLDVLSERGRGSIWGFFEEPRQDRRAATAALARDGSVAGFTARALASARPRRPAKKDLWSSSAAARASRSYLCVLSAVYISWARMVWTCVEQL